jgi:hypothetical protein
MIKLKPEINDLVNMDLNDNCSAKVMPVAGEFNSPGFHKLMVFYRNGEVVWAHKDCVVPEQPRSTRKNRKNLKKST